MEVSIELPLIIFHGNVDLLQHVWINLLTNAIKYTPENGKITITSLIKDNNIEISITDTGIGMTAGQLEYIFKKYYRVEHNTSVNGLGLGLPIVKRIIELSGGLLQVTSTPGIGSVFTVILVLKN